MLHEIIRDYVRARVGFIKYQTSNWISIFIHLFYLKIFLIIKYIKAVYLDQSEWLFLALFKFNWQVRYSSSLVNNKNSWSFWENIYFNIFLEIKNFCKFLRLDFIQRRLFPTK